uniref:Uncharacterized protein n=1 Tax=Coccolithus braarudii TaxID=221442 RepID=A0A7S0QA12_9EUKA|mmetsp:Transcript_531/g.1082  ORF Transcript_531/g.1082 Transcript_531/m.1082 type:complete len:186 (+) Transcript_531:193-750(+)|eukprot:CAMPEP_0183341970 /NCGR_PEP_ID=MMETSP0164_2-20130417/8163_1 /TAXON_ID=221442 /ORGANISM="Coccolithus pelagicus ssp braarudi, Strain PLY182g" /LENGTH=185 /DNA_ID=CAMNT_0025512435 /DNA_START=119 /DNA_END=676 /DNA_ORIENTATION=+
MHKRWLQKRPAAEMESSDNADVKSLHRQWVRSLRDDYDDRISRASFASSTDTDTVYRSCELDHDSSDGDDEETLPRRRRQSCPDFRRAHSLTDVFVHALETLDSVDDFDSGEMDEGEGKEPVGGGSLTARRNSAVEEVEEEWLNTLPPMLRRQNGAERGAELWRLIARGLPDMPRAQTVTDRIAS